MKINYVLAILSISLLGCQSSGTFKWKSNTGETYYVEKEDISCQEYYAGTQCKVNGYSKDLAGSKKVYSGEGWCAATPNGTIMEEFMTTYKSDQSKLPCSAAHHFKKV